MSTTTTTTSNPSSPSPSPSNQVNVPTSTVIAIGVGFVSFALLVLLFTVLLRIRRIRRLARTRASEGPVRFRETWEREGGWWGFWHTGDQMAVGAGGHGTGVGMRTELWRRRRLEELVRYLGEEEVEEPKMWEIGMKDDVGVVGFGDMKPLSILTSPKPLDTGGWYPSSLPDPTLSLNVLISLPTHNKSEEEIPDVVIGTTTLLPLVPHLPQLNSPKNSSALQVPIERAAIVKTGTLSKSERPGVIAMSGKSTRIGGLGESGVSNDLSKSTIEEKEELEYLENSHQRARWERDREGEWRIQGLGLNDG
ncbi:hypothetical protein TREMEDRAFT_61405 [Tremella mesenterica DSM 1558]|uniref:uncharacterized protein n=1 Tax=Tremella mesenterica (strain ATCC 24925 / CBS 8224 / DSM 1558 / NBRC 9311 / NRRL Y-6157 / RJB 2259-6 / UBC 559-6) TaxID=578456 RepID=UPI0003F4A652|nr:uncharacterized protein TREMEDRAFT_61405 [Tremella mesenterica DSM 1558]EIW70892.1 hypothetical protein TREMEDRAFT_61405 [Tremella mesenterica DSM 1558]